MFGDGLFGLKTCIDNLPPRGCVVTVLVTMNGVDRHVGFFVDDNEAGAA